MIDLDIRYPSLEDAFVDAFGRSIGDVELDVVAELAALAVEAIVAVWPVRTGTSAAAWIAEPMPAPAIGIRLFNGVDYAQYVRPAGTSPAVRLWEEAVDEVSERLGEMLSAALWEVASGAPVGGAQASAGWMSMPRHARPQRPRQPPSAPSAELTVYAGGE